MMPLAIALLVIGVLVGVLFVVLARDSGPGPADVAIAYERAWDRLDFSLLFDLSGTELRDGLDRRGFVDAKQRAHGPSAPRRVSEHIDVSSSVVARDAALVVTTVRTSDGEVHDDVALERREGRWVVIGYGLRRQPTPPDHV
jgi:hypothetical protein